MKKGLLAACYLIAVSTIATGLASAQGPSLTFPLDNGETPYTAQITSVLDHSISEITGFYCDPNRAVRAYTGEQASIIESGVGHQSG